jgi:RNA recognition motif-containing protein
MTSDEESNNAITGLNNKEIEGRSMSVSVAREKPKRADNKRW